MRKLIYIFVIVLLSAGCQKARLVEEWPDDTEQDANGRNGQAEQSDSTKVTPDFDTNGWEGSIDADFTFGGEETE